MRICSDCTFGGYLLVYLFLSFIVLLPSCHEEEPAPPVNPGMKKFAGTWEGTTSQKAIIRVVVSQNDLDQVVVSHTEINYLDDNKLRHLLLDDQQGLSFLSSGAFEIQLPDGGVMRGNFADGLLTGECIACPLTGELNINFKAVPENDSLSLHSVCRIAFDQSDGKHFCMVQDEKYFFPVAHCLDADSGYKAYSAMHFGSWENGGAPYFWIEAGLMEDPVNVADYFTTGIKRFSKNATDGFSIHYIDTDHHYYHYFAPDDTLMPAGSYFNITQRELVNTGMDELLRYKFASSFDIWLYTFGGDSVRLQNGFYSGFVESTVISE